MKGRIKTLRSLFKASEVRSHAIVVYFPRNKYKIAISYRYVPKYDYGHEQWSRNYLIRLTGIYDADAKKL